MQPRYLLKLKAIVSLSLGLLLLGSVFAPQVLAGRYVLNQTPQTIQRYFGRPWAWLTSNERVTYTYSPAGIRRLFPNFSEYGTFKITFVNNHAASISIDDFSYSFVYNKAEAKKFFNYIFGYNPPTWKLISSQGVEILERKYCLGDGVANDVSVGDLSLVSVLYYDPACSASPSPPLPL